MRLSKRSLVGARVERGFINLPMLCPLYLWPNIGFDVIFFKNRHDKEGVGERPVVGGGIEHVDHHKFTPIDIGVVNHRMDRLRVFLGESGVVELPGLEDPCQHIEDETIHGTHGRNRRAPLLGSGYEVSDAHFLQESGLIEPRSFFSDVEPEILSVPSKPVKNGCGVPMKKVGEVNFPKTEEEFTDEDCKKMELNAKAINMIYCGVNSDDYRKISRCETAKQMWEKLEVTYKGTAQVREAKINHLTHEYELFSMKENEKIEEMFERFSNIINPLNLLRKTYTDRELVRKVLRRLSPKWRSKVDVIEEGRDFQTTTYDALRGNLITYKTTQLSKVVEERSKRSIALPATTSTLNNVDDEDDDSDDTDLGLFVREFKKMMLKKGAKKNTPPKCYGCGDDSEMEEVANLCLMTIEDGETSKKTSIAWCCRSTI
ncbi:unnamed protein product [Cuscuta campestris]|uniref:Uncharacterized protein n=1 Tax=Cuscuta campestris TaxID=132261 RepID=A0A484MUD9_9ASTE|nr:unnamed protein product [Cuscuta campestris]